MRVDVGRVAMHLTSDICLPYVVCKSRTSGKGPIAFRCESFLASAFHAAAVVPRAMVLPGPAKIASTSEHGLLDAAVVPEGNPDDSLAAVPIEVRLLHFQMRNAVVGGS
jgi:hypothetical protein